MNGTQTTGWETYDSSTETRWHSKDTSAGQALVADETTGRTVAVAYDAGHGPLIAAAPDLLEALRGLVGEPGPLDPPQIRRARAAIARAEGGAA